MPISAHRLEIPEVILIEGPRSEDPRGYFAETYRAAWFADFGISPNFVQDNQAGSAASGTIRGLHFQAPPYAQAKLVRVLKGAIYDVAVDLRSDSLDFGRWVGTTLTTAGEQLFVPRGFAHGYCTLEANTEVAYKCDAYYSPDTEGGVLFSDPDIGIRWPMASGLAIVSDKDRRLPPLRDFMSPFKADETG
jgi:dTDP-4-dehydrorhamnose 3,5-epimerase